ncbi:MAG: glucose 1-dehydrogenase [Pseudomonadota bacterium]
MKAQEIFDLTGEVALITGASTGLGRNFAKVLAANGAKVVVAARSIDKLESLKSEIEAAGGEALAVKLDVSDREQIAPAFDEAEKTFGTVTLLINNAGISGSMAGLDMTPEEWRELMAVNLDAPWFAAQQAAKRMIAAETGGTIINIASVASFRALKTLAAYGATKAALKQLTSNLAVELSRHNIRVNAIAPGYILTEINREFFESGAGDQLIKTIPQRRIGDPSDLDGVLLLLASRRAGGFMTGETVIVDGGQVLGV